MYYRYNTYKNENPGPDQPSYNCYLLSIISKEKKNSEVPLFTTDISLIGNHYEVAFPNKMREVITLPCGIKLEKVDFKTRTGYRRAKTLCIRYLILSFNNFKRH